MKLRPVIWEGWHFIHMRKALDRIISLRREVWDNKTSLTSPLFIEVPVPNQECARHVFVC